MSRTASPTAAQVERGFYASMRRTRCKPRCRVTRRQPGITGEPTGLRHKPVWLGSPAYSGGMAFTGFPAEGFTFYEQLQADNSKAFWTEHKSDYEQYVLKPIVALGAELEKEFGSPSVFRPYRDIRFSADKSPYKTYQGMFVERAPGLGFYAGLSADGVLVSGGFHSHASDQVERYRHAVGAHTSGRALADLMSTLAADGLAVEGDQMKTDRK